MFWKAWKPNQQAMPAAATRPKTSSAWRAMTRARQMTRRQQRDQQAGAHEAELLPRHREDEVGLLLGHEAGARLGAVEQALPEQAAVADRDPGLLDVVAGAAGVEVGVHEGEEAVDLVGLQHATGEGERGDRAGRRAARRPASAAERPDTASTPNTVAESTSIVPRSGWSRIRTAGTPAITSISRTSTEPTRRRQRPSERSASTSAMPMTTASFANSDGWIERPSDPQPRPRAVDGRAHGQHEHQPGHRQQVDERRDDPHPPVVGDGDPDEQHQPDDDVDQLLAQVRRRVAVGQVHPVRGRRPDQQGGQRDQREHGEPSRIQSRRRRETVTISPPSNQQSDPAAGSSRRP